MIVLISESLLLNSTARDGRVLRDRMLSGFCVRMHARRRTFRVATSVAGKQFRMTLGQLWQLLQVHGSFFRHPGAMVVGDLNSNTCWDAQHPAGNHSDVVQNLATLGLQSSHHAHRAVPQGAEQHPNLYLHRHLSKPYQIDYAFSGPSWVVKHVDVGSPERWLQHSDHMPVVNDLERAE